jgi:hypothetical protein
MSDTMAATTTKEVVSVSLGSSKRDHEVVGRLLDQTFRIRRVGTDGNFKKAIEILKEIDGKVDAIGLGGVDVYLYSRRRRFALRDGLRLMDAVKTTPVVDGSGLKNSLEREVIGHIAAQRAHEVPLAGRKVLMVCAMDRFGMAQAFEDAGARVTYGDLIFALGLDKPITSLGELDDYADRLLPDIVKMPIGFLYPIGKQQESAPEAKYTQYYDDADIVAGDYHFIRKYMPARMDGKVIVTNTVTASDVDDLRARGVAWLVTTTPEFEGRSFGTNVLEAALLALLGKAWDDVTPEDYLDLIKRLDLKPRVVRLA